MSQENLSQLLTTLQSLSNGAEALIFEFVAKFTSDGQPVAAQELALEQNEANSVPEVPDLVFFGAIVDDSWVEDLPEESIKSTLSEIGRHLASIYPALKLPKKIIEEGGWAGKSYSLECGGLLVAVPSKCTKTDGDKIESEASWEMLHNVEWNVGFRGFIVNYFTWEEIMSQSASLGVDCRVVIEEE